MTTPVATSVWDDLVGQEAVVATLRSAVADGARAMSHAWLVTGPPGSGRSNAALAFAAALQCDRGGCGVCTACRTSVSGAHPDVTLVRTEKLSIGVDEVRDLVRRAASAPTLGRRMVIIVEDADRITERGANALLKAIEEPAPRTVWLLCAPTADDVIVTIRSRCRHVGLVTPPEAAVARLLTSRDGVPADRAAVVAHVAQGHIGRARALARDPQAMIRRRAVLEIPNLLTGLGPALKAAEELVARVTAEAAAATADLDSRERDALNETLTTGGRGPKARHAAAALKDLEDQQKLRTKRYQRDGLDGALTELTGYYRDVLVVQTAAGVPLLNADLAAEVTATAEVSTPDVTIRRLDAILDCREKLARNVPNLLAVEALFTALSS
jgi:DNA polymerase-3 subunit delta'